MRKDDYRRGYKAGTESLEHCYRLVSGLMMLTIALTWNLATGDKLLSHEAAAAATIVY